MLLPCLIRLLSAILRCCVLCGWTFPFGPSTGRASLKCETARLDYPKDNNRAQDSERNRIAVVMIRLARVGARKQPYYRIVVIEKDRARNGRSIEVVGTYNPRTNPMSVELKHERIAYWRGQGAQLSPIVLKLVNKAAATAPAADAPADAAAA